MCRRFANYYAALAPRQQNKPVDFKKVPNPETYGLPQNTIDINSSRVLFGLIAYFF